MNQILENEIKENSHWKRYDVFLTAEIKWKTRDICFAICEYFKLVFYFIYRRTTAQITWIYIFWLLHYFSLANIICRFFNSLLWVYYFRFHFNYFFFFCFLFVVLNCKNQLNYIEKSCEKSNVKSSNWLSLTSFVLNWSQKPVFHIWSCSSFSRCKKKITF